MTDIHDCGGDAAAYVLGAMDASEAESFERRLETCGGCREEVAGLRQVANALPMTAPQLSTPKHLRRRVMAEVRADVRAERSVRSRGTQRRSWRPAWPQPVLAGIATGALAAAVLVGASSTLTAGGPQHRRVYNADVGSGQLRVLDGHGVLVVHRLPVPPPDRIYEVWVQHADGRVAPTTSLFSVTRAGDGDAAVPGNLKGAKAVMVTLEPAGGTSVPTTKPVIVARLS